MSNLKFPKAIRSMPGAIDTLNCFRKFYSDDEYGFPYIIGTDFIPDDMQMFDYFKTKPNTCTHFFIDDYRFETVWNRPFEALKILKKSKIVCSPTFSTFQDDPKIVQMWNTYRNRWCGAFWESEGIKVIPSIVTAGKESYNFAFRGIIKHSVVATMRLGKNRPYHNLENDPGYNAIMEHIDPIAILLYAENFETSNPRVFVYSTFWEQRRQSLKEQKEMKYKHAEELKIIEAKRKSLLPKEKKITIAW
jgi:hypothetical protein